MKLPKISSRNFHRFTLDSKCYTPNFALYKNMLALSLLMVLPLLSQASTPDFSTRYLYSYIASDLTNLVVGPDATGITHSAATYSQNGAWTASIPGAQWIWDSYFVSAPGTSQYVVFTNNFGIIGSPQSANLIVGGDNNVWVYVNGRPVLACEIVTNGFSTGTVKTCNVTPYVNSGMNIITFHVQNLASSSDPTANPAGLLYKLAISSAAQA